MCNKGAAVLCAGSLEPGDGALGYIHDRTCNRTMDILNRITSSSQQFGGRPCVRGMRIRVTDVLDLLDAGLSREAILAEMPDLEADDISACIRFARHRVVHPVLTG